MKNQTVNQFIAPHLKNWFDIKQKVHDKECQIIRAKANLEIAHLKRDTDKVSKLDNKIKSLDKSRVKLSNNAGWVQNILMPIAEYLKTALNGHSVEIAGPFGLSCETSVWIYKDEQAVKDRNLDEIYSLTLHPFYQYSVDGKYNVTGINFFIKDYNVDTETFEENTIGAINGGNHPNVDIMNWTMQQVVQLAKLK